MSCNGCRVLRKGCSESCVLRHCLQWIESPQAQAHATSFVAKFFGRAGLMSFISAVPQTQRPAIFQSLLFEAAGRTINPVNGAVGLLWTGNWHECQAAVETVLRGGTLCPVSEFHSTSAGFKGVSDSNNTFKHGHQGSTTFKHGHQGSTSRSKRRRVHESSKLLQVVDLDLDLSLTQGYEVSEKRQLVTVSRNSEESVTTTCFGAGEPKLLNLF